MAAAKGRKRNVTASKSKKTETYRHAEATSLMRPEVGTQAQFKKKKPPKTYHYDSSLSTELVWDAKNPAREQGEALIKQILDADKLEDLKAAASKRKGLIKSFLKWSEIRRLSLEQFNFNLKRNIAIPILYKPLM